MTSVRRFHLFSPERGGHHHHGTFQRVSIPGVFSNAAASNVQHQQGNGTDIGGGTSAGDHRRELSSASTQQQAAFFFPMRRRKSSDANAASTADAAAMEKEPQQQQQQANANTNTNTNTNANPNTYPQWHSAVAGAAAGAGSRLLTAPLDLLRIRRQLQLDHPPPSSLSSAAFTDAIKSASRRPIGAKAIDAARDAAAKAASENVNNFFWRRFGLLSSLAQIARDEGGIRSLFRGNVAATYLWITYAAVQFSLYSRTSDFISGFAVPPSHPAVIGSPRTAHDVDNNRGPRGLAAALPSPIQSALGGIAASPTAVAFASGATAGLCATLTTYPFDLCRTTFAAKGLASRAAAANGGGCGAAAAGASAAAAGASSAAAASSSGLAPPQSLAGFVKEMYRRRGIRGFYAGAAPAAVQIVPYMGINFALYDYFTRKFDQRSIGGAGLAGTVAGGTSKFLVYPMDTIKKRLQAQATIGLNHRQYRDMADCAWTMMREEGLAAFYRGLAPTVLKSCAATGLTFAMYTASKNVLEAAHDGLATRKRRRISESESKDR